MSQFEKQDYLYPNRYKRGDGPDFTGKITIGGIEYRLSAWKTQNGEVQMQSLKAETEAEYQARKAASGPPRPSRRDSEYEYKEPDSFPEQNITGSSPVTDDIPF